MVSKNDLCGRLYSHKIFSVCLLKTLKIIVERRDLSTIGGYYLGAK